MISAFNVGRTQREFLAHERLFQLCCDEKEVLRSEVLVDVLFVVAVLKRCLRIETEGISAIKPVHSSRQHIASVVAVAVIIHGIGSVIIGMIDAIWVATLGRMVEKHIQTHRPKRCRLLGKSYLCVCILQVVSLLSRIKVAKKSIVVVVVSSHMKS